MKNKKISLLELSNEFIQKTMQNLMLELSQYFRNNVNIFVIEEFNLVSENTTFHLEIGDYKINLNEVYVNDKVEKILLDIFDYAGNAWYPNKFFKEELTIAGEIILERWKKGILISN